MEQGERKPKASLSVANMRDEKLPPLDPIFRLQAVERLANNLVDSHDKLSTGLSFALHKDDFTKLQTNVTEFQQAVVTEQEGNINKIKELENMSAMTCDSVDNLSDMLEQLQVEMKLMKQAMVTLHNENKELKEKLYSILA